MTELATFLVVAALSFGLAFFLRLPVIPLLLAGGVLLAQTPLAPAREISGAILELGLAFLVFSAGIELSPRRFTHQTNVVLWVALVQFFLVGAIGFYVAQALGYSHTAAVYIGFALSASSTLVVIRHLRRQQQMFQPFGRLVTGVLLVQDVSLIVLLTLLSAGTQDLVGGAWSVGALLLLGGVAAGCHYFVLPRLVKKLLSDDETLLLLALAILFLFLGAAYLLELPTVAGAFLAGFTLSAFPVNGLLRGLIGSLNDFFQALFFTALGALLVIPSWTLLGHALLMAVMVFFVTPPIVALVAEWRGQSSRSGIESGLLLAQTSELSIVFALIGSQLGYLGAQEFTLVALVAALTMTITPFVATDAMTWKLLRLHPSRRRKPPSLGRKHHILVLGFGSAGMWAVKPLMNAGYEVLVVDDDPVVIEALSVTKVESLRADGSDPHVLEQVNAREARIILAAIPKLADLLKVIHYVPGVPVVARVQEAFEAAAIAKAGGVPISNSEAAADEFLKWFENFCCRSDSAPPRSTTSPAQAAPIL